MPLFFDLLPWFSSTACTYIAFVNLFSVFEIVITTPNAGASNNSTANDLNLVFLCLPDVANQK